MSSLDIDAASGKAPGRIKPLLDWLTVLPEAGEEWMRSDIPDGVPMKQLRNRGLIESTGEAETIRSDGDGRSRWQRNYWTVTEDAQQIFDEADRFTPCTCGHAGLHNAGDHFECNFEPCDNRDQEDELDLDQ